MLLVACRCRVVYILLIQYVGMSGSEGLSLTMDVWDTRTES